MNNQKGAVLIILLNFLFVALGITLLIMGLFTNRNLLAQIPDIFKR